MTQTSTGDKNLADIAKAMKDIDFVMLNTHTSNGRIGARPMSNNREVDYDGDSYYFTWADSRMANNIAADPNVGLSFQQDSSLFGKPGMFVAIEGIARLVRDTSAFAEHWSKDLDRWFEQGVDTPGLVMIHVRAQRIAYWDGKDEGEIAL